MNPIVQYLGLDVHKDSISIGIASSDGEVRFYGKVGGKLGDVDRALKKIQDAHPTAELRLCYQAGPTGYGLYRHLVKRGFQCIVVAPSLTPHKAGDHIKNDRRDCLTLARSHRAGDLTAIHVPDLEDEAVRDVVRARFAAVQDQRVARQRLKGFLLRLDFRYSGKSSWTSAHRNYLARLSLTPSEDSSGSRRHQGAITKSGNEAARRVGGLGAVESGAGFRSRRKQPTPKALYAARRALVEAAHPYALPPCLSPTLQSRINRRVIAGSSAHFSEQVHRLPFRPSFEEGF